MSEQHGEKMSIRRVDVRSPTADEKLLEALKAYLRKVGKPEHLALEALHAVKRAVDLPEDRG